jgi:MFS transporter, BCD family, chlorophyll transporter
VNDKPIGWIGILRLGLIQAALGSIIVMMTSTINRVMVIELALPAVVPGCLVALHYVVQILRPAWGFGSDISGRRTPWIIGGMAVLACGGIGAALATVIAATQLIIGLSLAVLSFVLVGIGVGVAGTSTLALLASRVTSSRRAAAATAVWIFMIAGFAVTAPIAGHFLDPFSNSRLVIVTTSVAGCAFLLATISVWGIETEPTPTIARTPPHNASEALRAVVDVWREPGVRRLTIFIFVSMLAYSAQELLVEPFAGLVFHLPPGATTQLAGVQHGGALIGMLAVSFAASAIAGPVFGSLKLWTIGGCLASAAALLAVAISGFTGAEYALRPALFSLGAANGSFAVAAISTMMALAGAGGNARQGTRIGVWGASQALAFGVGELTATSCVDLARNFTASPATAYALIFCVEALVFILAAILAAGLGRPTEAIPSLTPKSGTSRRHLTEA